VEWHFQREAERAVRRLTGVRGVNLIAVKPGVDPKRSDIKRRIEDTLVRSAETDAERIKIRVEGGKVTLVGAVRA
jgi:osmotically-inducible protein OsmY